MKTEIGLAAGMGEEVLEAVAKNMPMLDSADISQAVIYVLGTKPHVQVKLWRKLTFFNCHSIITVLGA